MAIHSSILACRISMDRGAWQATVHGVSKELDTVEQLNNNGEILGGSPFFLTISCLSLVNLHMITFNKYG